MTGGVYVCTMERGLEFALCLPVRGLESGGESPFRDAATGEAVKSGRVGEDGVGEKTEFVVS